MPQLTIVANIKANSNKVDLVMAKLEKLIVTTRSQQGCLQYDWHQGNENPVHFFLRELGIAKTLTGSLQAHHLNDYSVATEGAIDDFTIHEMTRIAQSRS